MRVCREINFPVSDFSAQYHNGSHDTYLSIQITDLNNLFSIIICSITVFNDSRVQCEAKTLLIKLSSNDKLRLKEMADAQRWLGNKPLMNT